MARVLIVGCGYVGTALGVALARDGHEVLGLRRSAGGLPDGISPVNADVTVASTLWAIPEGVDVVFYLASPAGFDDGAYRAAYLDGLRNVAPRIRQARRLFLATSTAVYGQADGEWVDETSPTEPSSFSGRRLIEAERIARSGPVPATAVRFGGIYGPGRTRLVRQVLDRRAVLDDRPAYTNRIHRDDCAGALAHLMNLDAPDDVYVGVDNEPAEREEVLSWLAARLGVPPPRPGGVEGGPKRGGNKRCRNDRLRATGYRFAYPSYREGYAAIIATFER